MGDLRVLVIQDEQIAGALRSASGHEIEETLHGRIVPEDLLRLGVHPGPQILSFRLFHGGIFFLGQTLPIRLRFLLLRFAVLDHFGKIHSNHLPFDFFFFFLRL